MTISTANLDQGSDSPRLARTQLKEAVDLLNRYDDSDGSSLVGFIQSGSGSAATTVQTELRRILRPENFGAVGDGVTDDTLAFVNLAAAITSGSVVECNGSATYLISHTNAGNSDAYGKKVMYFTGKKDVHIRGNGALIKCVSHDIATNGGLMWLWAEACPRIKVSGFRFDMTFTGVKNSSASYPFCGAMIFPDAQTGVQTQDTLCSYGEVWDCKFKLYHQYGNWATTTAGNDFGGDNNNGYKLFAVYFSGDAAATTYATQNRNVKIHDITFEEGHNGYGVWCWAINDLKIYRITGESWVSKYSNNSGVIQGAGVPMVRYTQFYNSGIVIEDCDFRAKPCDERTTVGFEGEGCFTHLTQNLTGDRSNGKCTVRRNKIILGNGDAANSLTDIGVYVYCYGDVDISGNNQFDGITTTTNAYAGKYINKPAALDNGKSTLKVDGNIFGVNGSYNDVVVIDNGNNTSEYQRRLKALHFTNNIVLSHLQYVVDTFGKNGAAKTYDGLRYTQISGNTIVGTYDTVFGSASTSSLCFRLAATETTDMIIVRNNPVIDINTFISAANVNSAANVVVEDNPRSGVTTVFSAGTLIDFQSAAGTFTPVLKGAGTAGTPTTTVAIGRYTRKANRCYWDASITITAAGGAIGNWLLDLNDIPYTIKNVSANHVPVAASAQSNLAVGAGKELAVLAINNTKTYGLYAMDQAGGAIGTITAAADAAFTLYASGNFEVA